MEWPPFSVLWVVDFLWSDFTMSGWVKYYCLVKHHACELVLKHCNHKMMDTICGRGIDVRQFPQVMYFPEYYLYSLVSALGNLAVSAFSEKKKKKKKKNFGRAHG